MARGGSQAETRLERGVNVCATTDTRLIGKPEWGERPSRVHTHAEIMDCITLGGRAVPPDRVGLHVYPIGVRARPGCSTHPPTVCSSPGTAALGASICHPAGVGPLLVIGLDTILTRAVSEPLWSSGCAHLSRRCDAARRNRKAASWEAYRAV